MSLTEKIEHAVPDGMKAVGFASMWVSKEFVEDSLLDTAKFFREQLAERLADPWVLVTAEASEIDPVHDAHLTAVSTVGHDAVLVCGVSYEPDETLP